MSDIFITYRRTQVLRRPGFWGRLFGLLRGAPPEPSSADVSGHARMLFQALAGRFGPECLFFDLDSLDPGVDFPEELQQALARAKVQLVVIPPEWEAEIRYRAAYRQSDWVCKEIALGLARSDLHIIPVLMQRGDVAWEGLPDCVRPLEHKQEHRFTEQVADWENQHSRLCDKLAAFRSYVPGSDAMRLKENLINKAQDALEIISILPLSQEAKITGEKQIVEQITKAIFNDQTTSQSPARRDAVSAASRRGTTEYPGQHEQSGKHTE